MKPEPPPGRLHENLQGAPRRGLAGPESALGGLPRERHVAGGERRGDAHGGRDPQLAPVAGARVPHHEAADELVDRCRHPSPFWSSPAARARIRWAIRLWSVNSSMNPGLAAWLNSPPDSPNAASERSYRACGELRATAMAEPL